MLDLTTPKVRTDHRLAAEFRPKKVEPWLERLPTADRETCVQQLHTALTAQNRVALAPALRLQLMELYLGPFLEIYASHHSDLSAIARVPLHPHYRSKQQDMLALLEALAVGYKIVVVDLAARRRGQFHRLDLALALQRAVHYLGQVIVTAFEVYTRPPGGTWRDLYQLYRCAEEEDLCEFEVRPLVENGGPPDVRSTCLPILLVGAGAPLGLLPGEVRRLHDLAPQWRSTLKLSDGSGAAAGPGHFRINLDSDGPPVPMSKSKGIVAAGKLRVLRTLGVARAMHEALTNMSSPAAQRALRSVLLPGLDSVDVEMFRRAGRVLGEVNIKRGSTRFEADQELEFCAGFDSVYLACSNGRLAAPAGPEPSDVAPETPRAGAEQFIDLSEPMLGVPAAGRPDVDTASRHAVYRVRAVNRSAGGMCLRLPLAPEARLKVGDIAACRTAGGPDWQLATVRWMRAGSKEIRFGIQFLGPDAVPVKLASGEPPAAGRGDDEAGGAFEGIWLPENAALRQPGSIILPRAAEPYPARVAIVDRSAAPGRVPPGMRVLGPLDRTGDYERLLVSPDPASPEA